ncbi:MAG: hypothetical protein F6K06_10490 [Okeania sp. SIO1H4]|nr:hypothetical protein [Okeania sp. SIO1H5]NES76203.1 hypothetical protein [Okeania sp. SIO1H4]
MVFRKIKFNIIFIAVMLVIYIRLNSQLKKETGDRRQETGGKLHGDSHPK